MHHFILTDTTNTIIDNKAGKRTFNGIANSGKPFVYQGERAIADLSDITFSDKIPALLLHDRDKRVGFGSLSVQNHQLIVSGDLLDNEHGKQVAAEADAGFPWQMSAHIIAGFVETLPNGQTAQINGQTITDDIKILRHCRVSEISFTPTGVDNQTMAMILSDFVQNQSVNAAQSTPDPIKSNRKNTMNIDELTQKITELTQKIAEQDKRIGELETENQTLKDANAKLEADGKQATVEAKLSAKGFVKDNQGKWVGVDNATFEVLLSLDGDKASAIIDNLAAPKADVPEFLLGENYTSTHQNQTTTNLLLAVVGGKF